jgi:hypothetical protein
MVHAYGGEVAGRSWFSSPLLRRLQAHHVRQLEALGYKVLFEPAA